VAIAGGGGMKIPDRKNYADPEDYAEDLADARLDARLDAEVPPGQAIKARARARRAKVWLLRAEGLTLQAIGDRMGGIGKERVRQILWRYAREMRHALRQTRWGVQTDEGLRPVASEVLEADRAAIATVNALGGPWDWLSNKERRDWRELATLAASDDVDARNELGAVLAQLDADLLEREQRKASA
jgi:hypothetical protein